MPGYSCQTGHPSESWDDGDQPNNPFASPPSSLSGLPSPSLSNRPPILDNMASGPPNCANSSCNLSADTQCSAAVVASPATSVSPAAILPPLSLLSACIRSG